MSKDPTRRPTARQLLDRLLGQESPVADMPEPMITEARTLVAERPPRPAPLAIPAPRSETPAPAFGDTAALPQNAGTPSPEAGGWFGDAPAPQYPPAAGAQGAIQSETAVYPEFGGFVGAPVPGGGDQQPPISPWQRDARPAPVAAHPSSGGPPQPRTRGANRPLGVLISLAVGVLAGAAIIVLVLWPQMRGSGKGNSTTATSRPAADNRPVSSIPQAFAGTWRGTAVNSQRQASFSIQVIFGAGRTTAHAVYPRNCVCRLTLTRGTGVRLEMTLQPARSCKSVTPGDVVVTRKPGGGLEYAWARTGTSLSYRAALSRG
jgi:hypothetical protein